MKTLKFIRTKDGILQKNIMNEFKNNNIEIQKLTINFSIISVEFDETQYTDTQIENVINTVQEN